MKVPSLIIFNLTAKSGKAGKSDDGAKSAAAKATDKAANTIATAIAKVVEKTNSKKQVVNDYNDSEEEDDESEVSCFLWECTDNSNFIVYVLRWGVLYQSSVNNVCEGTE